jgi:hypothetical protein
MTDPRSSRINLQSAVVSVSTAYFNVTKRSILSTGHIYEFRVIIRINDKGINHIVFIKET